MSNDRPKRETMSIEESTMSNRWKIVAVVEVFERKGTEFRQRNARPACVGWYRRSN
jgi:hypothetical protein